MDSKLLKSQIILSDKSVPGILKELGISKSAYYRKLKGTSEFTRLEISKIISYLNLSTDMAMRIFFKEKVS